MKSIIRKSIAGLALAASVVTIASPAEARRWRDRGSDDAAIAIGAGLLGLGIGAALADGYRHRGGYYGYYDRPYYPRYYRDRYYGPRYYGRSYYGRPYHRGYYRPDCYTRRVYDPYIGRRVKVRYCR